MQHYRTNGDARGRLPSRFRLVLCGRYSKPDNLSAGNRGTDSGLRGRLGRINFHNNGRLIDGAFLRKLGYVLAGTPLTNVASDPNFMACSTKKIGFAVKGGTDPSGTGVCTQNKYTETSLNQISSASGQPYVTAVIYASKNYPGRFLHSD